MKGMDWLSRYLNKDKNAALYAIGDDAPSVFFEIWYTSADSRIRCKARGIAETLIEKYESALLSGRQPARGTEQFFECMFMLRCKHEMGLDTTALLNLSDDLFKSEGLRDTDRLFGVGKEKLRDVSVADWLLLLMRVMCLEYNNLLHRKVKRRRRRNCNGQSWKNSSSVDSCFKACFVFEGGLSHQS
jgi:hypothetical protein